jgi:Amidase
LIQFRIAIRQNWYAAPITVGFVRRIPTLTGQLYQLANGTVTSDELVRRSLHAINASQSKLNVPAGSTSDGLPIGVQLMGPANSEPLLVSPAAALEAIRGRVTEQPDAWWDTPPPSRDETIREDTGVQESA